MKKILIVEDEAIIAADLEVILTKNGWSCLPCCDTAEDAIESIKTNAPDMVLIDIHLIGEHSGIYVANYLLAEDKIPYIYITSHSDPMTVDEVKKSRPMGYILKPFKPEIIKATIEIAFCNHKHRNIDPVRNSTVPKSDVPFKIRKITDYIANNLDKKLEVGELADMTDWKFHHFIRVFKTYLGVTPYQYILEQKVSKSIILLKETDLPIAVIAYDLGFQSHSNFCKTFQKKMQMSAENFRRKSRI